METLLFLGFIYIAYKLINFSKQSDNNNQKSQSEYKGPKPFASSQPRNLNNDDSDELATFTISYGYDEEKSKNITPGKWVPAGESIEIKGREIKGGNFYFGGQLKSLDGYGMEASLVDDSLKANAKSNLDFENFEDDTLSYWPKYISISPRCRGIYLDWLASDRKYPHIPMGFVFIYFYGLERRIVVDGAKGKVSDTEFRSLFIEIIRLRKHYSENRSFSSYSTRLMELMCLLRPEVVFIPDTEFTPSYDSLLFKHQLATAVNAGKAISPDIALGWIKIYPEYSLRTPARRCNSEFGELFKSRYINKFGEGLKVKPNKTRLKLEYWPASNSIRGIEIEQEDLPDPSILKAPVKKLITIADMCTDELDAYSRYLGKKGTSKNDVAAILLLPDELVNTDSSSVIAKFKSWADKNILENKGLVDVSEFWAHTGITLPDKINKKEIELITRLASKAGYGFAPDPRFHNAKPSASGMLVLFSEGHGEYFEPSKAFNEVGMALRLGAMVANIDSNLDRNELEILHQLIDHDTKLSPTEKNSLHAYLTWRLNSPSNMTGLKARLSKFGNKEKSAVSHILVGVALADGKIDPTEIKQLEKLYAALGLDKELVTSDIHTYSTLKSDIKSSNKRQNQQEPSIEKKDNAGFSLDEDILAIHESETEDVKNILGAIFVEEELEEQQEDKQTVPSSINSEGLDKSHQSLYERLIEKEKWDRKEVMSLCQDYSLMLDGAIETINDWSYEKVDAPVLDDDSDIYVDLEIVQELEV